jgi:hypothetical protein
MKIQKVVVPGVGQWEVGKLLGLKPVVAIVEAPHEMLPGVPRYAVYVDDGTPTLKYIINAQGVVSVVELVEDDGPPKLELAS